MVDLLQPAVEAIALEVILSLFEQPVACGSVDARALGDQFDATASDDVLTRSDLVRLRGRDDVVEVVRVDGL
ncbi:MAG: hypothetical protein ABI887_05625 [Burkholderiales bacterium]